MRLTHFLILCTHATANHYKVLGVPNSAAAADVKLAYRKAALKYHPDRMPKSASAESRRKAQRTFEQCNSAFEVLGDPAKRRQYDYDLANPVEQGADGVFRQGAPGATPARPLVEVQVACSLEMLGGWVDASIPVGAWSQSLGATVTEAIALRLGLPLRLYLPPGSRHGDTVRYVLRGLGGPRGVDVDFKLVAMPHRRMKRRGDTLFTSVSLPAWHNALGACAIRVRGLDGASLTVRARGVRTARGGEKVRLAGQGMPVLGSDSSSSGVGSASAAERGILQVELSLRTAAEEVAYVLRRGGVGAAAALLGRAAARRVPRLALALFDTALAASALVGDFLTTEVFGRARPEARMERMRQAAERLDARQRRHADREVRRRQEERARRARRREERWSQLCRPFMDRFGKAKAAWAEA